MLPRLGLGVIAWIFAALVSGAVSINGLQLSNVVLMANSTQRCGVAVPLTTDTTTSVTPWMTMSFVGVHSDPTSTVISPTISVWFRNNSAVGSPQALRLMGYANTVVCISGVTAQSPWLRHDCDITAVLTTLVFPPNTTELPGTVAAQYFIGAHPAAALTDVFTLGLQTSLPPVSNFHLCKWSAGGYTLQATTNETLSIVLRSTNTSLVPDGVPAVLTGPLDNTINAGALVAIVVCSLLTMVGLFLAILRLRLYLRNRQWHRLQPLEMEHYNSTTTGNDPGHTSVKVTRYSVGPTDLDAIDIIVSDDNAELLGGNKTVARRPLPQQLPYVNSDAPPTSIIHDGVKEPAAEDAIELSNLSKTE